MRRVLIIRHGESEWNREGRWQGWEDIALTATGEEQARFRGTELHADGHRFVAIFTSDLIRASRTAELIGEILGGPRARPVRGLRERFGGEWQGRSREEIIERWPDERAAWRRGELTAPPGGEEDAKVLERIDAALGTIDATAPAGPVLVVTHHGVLRLLSSQAGVPITEPIPNLGGRWFELDGAVLRAGTPLLPLAPDRP
jgi:bisphosphoglycerate-dependent phosphoglycerate mutase family 1